MYCMVCLKHDNGNTLTASCKTFKTTSMTRHEDLPDYKHALAAGELKANFDTALSKAFLLKSMMKFFMAHLFTQSNGLNF